MSFTKDTQVTDAWALVAETGPSVFVQLKSGGPVLVQLAQALPTNSDGVVLEANELAEIVVDGFETGDALYARSFSDGETHEICVVGPGTAPA